MAKINPEMRKLIRREVSRLLTEDCYDVAEKLTGQTIETDDLTQWVGAMGEGFMRESRIQVMKDQGDTYWGMPWEEFLFNLSMDDKFEWKCVYESEYSNDAAMSMNMVVEVDTKYGALMIASGIMGKTLERLDLYIQIDATGSKKFTVRTIEESDFKRDLVTMNGTDLRGVQVGKNQLLLHTPGVYGVRHWLNVLFDDEKFNPVSPWLPIDYPLWLPDQNGLWKEGDRERVFDDAPDKIKTHFGELL